MTNVENIMAEEGVQLFGTDFKSGQIMHQLFF